jgi:hypothetical protein
MEDTIYVLIKNNYMNFFGDLFSKFAEKVDIKNIKDIENQPKYLKPLFN